MRQFQHIEIHKDNASLMALVKKMIALQGMDYVYNKEASDRTNEGCQKDTNCRGTYYALFSTTKPELFCTTVSVSVKDDELKVFNINSTDYRYSDLGITRYNMVINTFFHHFMARCLDESFTGCVSITGEMRSLEEELGEETYKALHAWESTCNKEHPISHPMDEQMWFDFVCKLHASDKSLHPSDFSQWLSEDCKWPSYYNDAIEEMAEKLEYSISLLDYYVNSDNA